MSTITKCGSEDQARLKFDDGSRCGAWGRSSCAVACAVQDHTNRPNGARSLDMTALLNLTPIARLLTMKEALDETRVALDPNRKQKMRALRATLAKDYSVPESEVEIIAAVCYDTEFAPRTTMRDMMCAARLWPMPTELDTIGQCQWIIDCLAANGTCIKAESTMGMSAQHLREKLDEVISESIGVFDPTAAIELIEFAACDQWAPRLPVTFWMAMPQDGVLQFTIQGGSDAH